MTDDRLALIERDDEHGTVSVERAEEDMVGLEDPPAVIFEVGCAGIVGVTVNGPIDLLDLTPADLRVLGESLSWLASRTLPPDTPRTP